MFGKSREERNDKISCVSPSEGAFHLAFRKILTLLGPIGPGTDHRLWRVVQQYWHDSVIFVNVIQRIQTQFYMFNRQARLKFISFTGITESCQYY